MSSRGITLIQSARRFLKENEFRFAPDDPQQIEHRRRATSDEWKPYGWHKTIVRAQEVMRELQEATQP